MEAAWFVEILIPTNLITSFHIPDDCNLHCMVLLVGVESARVFPSGDHIMFLNPKTNRTGTGIEQSAQ
jgi:hypothetical protein